MLMKTSTTTLPLALCLALLPAATVTLCTGCAGNQYDRSTGQYIDDDSIHARVDADLAENPDYKFHSVKVTVFKGTVQLSGFVDTSAQKNEAGTIAQQVAGVRKVENSITVRSSDDENAGAVDDGTLKSDVDHALTHNPEYKFDGVKVAAHDGAVQLSGFVDTEGQKTEAGDIAKQVPGVKDVINNIAVKAAM